MDACADQVDVAIDSEFLQAFTGLAGQWRLRRKIPGIATFRGAAELTFSGLPDELAYTESGVLAMTSGHSAPASRRLLYRRLRDRLAIIDDDARRRGTLLHLLAFERPRSCASWLVASHRHHCGEDVYDIEMRIVTPDRFETRYRVLGPRKDYRMLTAYRRARTRGIAASA